MNKATDWSNTKFYLAIKYCIHEYVKLLLYLYVKDECTATAAST